MTSGFATSAGARGFPASTHSLLQLHGTRHVDIAKESRGSSPRNAAGNMKANIGWRGPMAKPGGGGVWVARFDDPGKASVMRGDATHAPQRAEKSLRETRLAPPR